MRRKIYAVLGVLPEPGGYAIAKFSRTPTYKSYRDWVMELTEEGAEKFYNSFYFQYGHASIADLAHLMVVFENISVPARNLLLDDQLIDAQSRSTRYVDYAKANLIIPPEIKKDKKILALYKKTCRELVSFYCLVCQKVTDFFEKSHRVNKPQDMDEECFLRILRARAFDVARYLLPCSIPKSMGIIASARTWERITTKFLSSPLEECRQIGKQMQKAICQKQAFNPSLVKLEQINWLTRTQREKIKRVIAGRNIALPTLVKYAQRKEYPENVYRKLAKMLPKNKLPRFPEGKRGVVLHQGVDPQLDFVTTLFYKIFPHSYRQLVRAIRKEGKSFWQKVIDVVYQYRGEHEAVMREAALGRLTFDICMDIGGFRDLHRHRNCIHILKDPTSVYGFDMPQEIREVGLEKEYQDLMRKVEKIYYQIEKKYPYCGQYVLPQAARRRFLMKISPWELQYITELRTKPAGHPSYREIAFKMYREFAKKYPGWAKHFRVTDYKKVDFFQR